MSDLPPVIPGAPVSPVYPPASARPARKPKGYFPPHIVRAVSFYIISLCIAASVVVCILAIWDFARKDSLWRLVASFLVVGVGTAAFAMVNGIFGDENQG
jgi:hypothetical protein